MSDSSSFKGRTLIYSNRPPTAGASGGAQAVIEASSPTWWVGPEAVADKIWNVMDEQERTERTLHGNPEAEEKPEYDVQTFPTPKSLEEQQYKTISNEILWPLAHSMPPNTDKTLEEIEAAYFDGYLPHNELANVALHDMAQEYALTSDDRIWVHDYQCDNVPGMVYSRHIPWPSVDFLESVSFKSENGQDVPLTATAFFRDFMELASGRALSTFQRPVDQANFIMTAARVAGEPELFSLESDNPALQNLTQDVQAPTKREAIQAALLDEIAIGGVSRLSLFGAKMSVMNVPVGQVTEKTYASAVENEHRLDKTRFKTDGKGHFNIFNADLGGETANLTACDAQAFDAHNPPQLQDVLSPIRGRDWVLSVHRNDYTKGTMTKMDAAEEVLADNPNATFLFVLQPTREDVGGYKEYAEQVFQKAQALREQYGEKSVVIIPEGVQHDDIVGMMRQPEMRGFMGLGHKDGHDLTVREVVDANDAGRPIGVITSSGIGASDVLGDGDKGAFVIENPTDAKEVAAALNDILSPQNTEALKSRFDFMKGRSQQYDAANFSKLIDAAYAPAMAHRFGENWRETFTQPDGVFIDRKGKQFAPEQDKPEYIKAILEGTAKSGQGISR